MKGLQYLSYYEKLNSFCQCIVLDENAHIIDSCDSIFPVKEVLHQPVSQTFDFFLGIYTALYHNSPINTDVRFSKVNAPHRLLPGIYDFTFTNILIKHQHYLLWQIYDFTELYEHYKHYQQRKNELEIFRQRIEGISKNLKATKEVIHFKNKIIDNFLLADNDYLSLAQNILLNPFYNLDDIAEILIEEETNHKEEFIVRLYDTYKLFISVTDELIEFSNTYARLFSKENTYSIQYICDSIAQTLHLSLQIEANDELYMATQHFQNTHFFTSFCKIIVGLFKNASVSNLGMLRSFRISCQQHSDAVHPQTLHIQFTESKSRDWSDVAALNDAHSKHIIYEKLLRLFALKKVVQSMNGKITIQSEDIGDILLCVALPVPVNIPIYSAISMQQQT